MMNNINNSKSKMTKINTQIQNKFNINVIDPRVSNNNYLKESGSLLNPANHMNLNLHKNNSNQGFAVNNKCPKVIIDYDHSSNSDLDHLYVTSGMDKKKMIRTNKGSARGVPVMPMGATFNYKNEIPSIKNTPVNKSFHQVSNIDSLGNERSSPTKKKQKQIFFPVEIDSATLNRSCQENPSMDSFTSKYKTSKTGNFFNFATPNSNSTNIFNSGNFGHYNGFNNNLYPFFSGTNTPRSSTSHNKYISDLILPTGNMKDTGTPGSALRSDQESASRNFSFMNSNFCNSSSLHGPVTINYTLFTKDISRNEKK